MSHPIGTLICYKDKVLRVEKAQKIECNGCFFFSERLLNQHKCSKNSLRCVSYTRKDNTNVIFALM